MAANKTSISAGLVIYSLLSENADVMAKAKKVYPVVADSATLPYVVYSVVGFTQTPVKSASGADSVDVQVSCYTEAYTDGVELAEAVRAALDGVTANLDGLVMRSCVLSDVGDGWQDDAYVQNLLFTCKI